MADQGAHVGLGRSGRPHAVTPTSFGGALGKLWAAVAGDTHQEERDRVKAERGFRLAKLLGHEAPSDVWDDIWVMFQEEADAQVTAIIAADSDEEILRAAYALRGLAAWAAKFDEKLALGAKSMQRLAERHTVLAQAAAGAHAEASDRTPG